MKKTSSIHIGGSVFTIDDDAYTALDAYLTTIKSHFTDEEVAADIEARIAERFMQMTSGARVVEMRDIDALIAVMGRVEDIVGESGEAPHVEATQEVRRLFRDYDNRVIEGVAAGFAAYFGIDVSMMRIIFVVVTLLSGVWLGLLAYVVLAAILPKAETPAEKMQMRGGPVTLTSFEQTIREKAADIESRHHLTSRAQLFFTRVFAAVGTVFRSGVSFIGRLIGAVITFFASAALITGTIFFVNVLVNSDAEYIKFPLVEVVSRPLFYTFVSIGFILCAIPVGAAFLFGIGLLRKRMIANAGMVFGILAGLWIIGVGSASVLWLKHGYAIEQKVQALPQYQVIEKEISVGSDVINAIKIRNGMTVTLVEAPTSSVMVRGGAHELDGVTTSIQGGLFSAERTYRGDECMFCGSDEGISLTIRTPKITSIDADSGAYVVSDMKFNEKLDVVATNGVRVKLRGSIKEIVARSSYGAFVDLGDVGRGQFTARDGGRIMYRTIDEVVQSVVERGGRIGE